MTLMRLLVLLRLILTLFYIIPNDNNNKVNSLTHHHHKQRQRKRKPIQIQPRQHPPNKFISPTCKSRQTRVVKETKKKTIVILYHKPKNTVTSHKSQDDRMTVYQDLEGMEGYVGVNSNDNNDSSSVVGFQKVTGISGKYHAVGRLDADTTGLLLFTNDGGLVRHITDPTVVQKTKSQVQGTIMYKTYEATIMGHHDQDSEVLEQIRKSGVNIGEKYGGWTAPPDDLKVLCHPTKSTTRVSITIHEGKNRQIRRMFHAVGSGVMSLHRVSVSSGINDPSQRLTLDGVAKEGQWRILDDKEVVQKLRWPMEDDVTNNYLLSTGNNETNSFRIVRKTKRRRLSNN